MEDAASYVKTTKPVVILVVWTFAQIRQIAVPVVTDVLGLYHAASKDLVNALMTPPALDERAAEAPASILIPTSLIAAIAFAPVVPGRPALVGNV